jgi:hypothetical protein
MDDISVENQHKILKLACFSYIVYKNPETIQEYYNLAKQPANLDINTASLDELDSKTIEYFKDLTEPPKYHHDVYTDIDCYTFKTPTQTIIAYRGTESFKDILTDINIFREPLYVNDKYLGKVHGGTLRQFKSIEPEITEIVKNTPNDTEICITGHSLGSINSTIASIYYKTMYPDKNIYSANYGSPRVGNWYFSRLCRTHLQNKLFRIINDDDPVTLVPSPLLYRHTGKCIWLNNNPNLKPGYYTRLWKTIKDTALSFVGLAEQPLYDHKSSNYCKIIDGNISK